MRIDDHYSGPGTSTASRKGGGREIRPDQVGHVDEIAITEDRLRRPGAASNRLPARLSAQITDPPFND